MVKRKAAAIVCSVSVIIGIVLSNADNYKSAAGNSLRFSQEAMEVMGNAESCRRDPYLCPAKIITQGIGHTGKGTGRLLYYAHHLRASTIRATAGGANTTGSGAAASGYRLTYPQL